MVSFISLLEEEPHVVSFALPPYERSKLITCMKVYRMFQPDGGGGEKVKCCLFIYAGLSH